MYKRFYLNKGIAGVKANTITVEYPDDTEDEVIRKDFTEWVFGQLDTAIIDPRVLPCGRCGQKELPVNLEINNGLCNDCENEENKY